MSDPAINSPLFIIGYGRSGTTLLRSVLDQHSKITLINEPELIFGLCSAGFHPDRAISAELLKSLPARVGEIPLCQNHIKTLSAEILSSLTSGYHESMTFQEVYETLLPAFSQSDRVWGEKSLNNVFFIRELVALYPRAVYLEIIRDPRSVCLSYLVKKKKITSEQNITNWASCVSLMGEHLLLWREWLLTSRAAKSLVPANAWLTIMYEDFITDPEKVVREICKFLGICFEPGMLDHQKRKEDRVLASKSAEAHQKISKPFDPSRGRSFHRMPGPLICFVQQMVGDLMKDLGYEQLKVNLSLLERATLKALIWKDKRKISKKVARKLGRRTASIRS